MWPLEHYLRPSEGRGRDAAGAPAAPGGASSIARGATSAKASGALPARGQDPPGKLASRGAAKGRGRPGEMAPRKGGGGKTQSVGARIRQERALGAFSMALRGAGESQDTQRDACGAPATGEAEGVGEAR